MNDTPLPARTIGTIMLLTFVIGIGSNFVLQDAVYGGAGFLAQAATQAPRIGLLALLTLAAAVLNVVISAQLCAAYGRLHPTLAWTGLGLAAASVATGLAEQAMLSAMQMVSQQFQASGPQALQQFEPTVAAVRGLRNGVHLLDKLLGGASVMVMFGLFLQARGLPRALAAAGLLGGALQMVAVAQGLFGLPVPLLLLAPLGLSYLVAAGWLLWRGARPAASGAAAAHPA
jgi:hypothetical protein